MLKDGEDDVLVRLDVSADVDPGLDFTVQVGAGNVVSKDRLNLFKDSLLLTVLKFNSLDNIVHLRSTAQFPLHFVQLRVGDNVSSGLTTALIFFGG